MDKLKSRLERVHRAFEKTESTDFSEVKTSTSSNLHGNFFFSIDFSGEKTTEELENVIHTLIANIGSIKDHLKKWCKTNNKVFNGDNLINSNINVSIIHDLWNSDKHDENTNRSKKNPGLENLNQSLSLSAGGVINGDTSVING